MLPARYRMRHSDEFSETVREGTRAGGHHVVLYVMTLSTRADEPRVGFVVSRAVGNAVRRNVVKRRLRALMARKVGGINCGSVVVRALPSAAEASYADLGRDLERCFGKVAKKMNSGARR